VPSPTKQLRQRPDLPQRQSSAIAESGAKRSLLGSYNAIHRNVSAVEDGLGNPDSEQEDEGMEEAELAAEDFEAEKNDIGFNKFEGSEKGPALSSEEEPSEEVPLEEESSEEEQNEPIQILKTNKIENLFQYLLKAIVATNQDEIISCRVDTKDEGSLW